MNGAFGGNPGSSGRRLLLRLYFKFGTTGFHIFIVEKSKSVKRPIFEWKIVVNYVLFFSICGSFGVVSTWHPRLLLLNSDCHYSRSLIWFLYHAILEDLGAL